MLLEIIIRGEIISVIGDRYLETDENEKISYNDANILYGFSMSKSLPFDQIKFKKKVCLDEILITRDDSDSG